MIKHPSIPDPNKENERLYYEELYGVPSEEKIITAKGEAYLDNLDYKNEIVKSERIKFWIGFGVSTAIAMGALIVSIIALLK